MSRGTNAVADKSVGRATSHLPFRPAVLQEELCSCEQARAAPRATRSRPLVSPPCVWLRPNTIGTRVDPSVSRCPHSLDPTRPPREAVCLRPRLGSSEFVPRAERPPAQALTRHAWSVSSVVLPSQKPGTSLSAALPDPTHSCRSAAPASKRAAVPSPPGPSRLQTGGRRMHLGEECGRGTPPSDLAASVTARGCREQRGGWQRSMRYLRCCDARDGGCLCAKTAVDSHRPPLPTSCLYRACPVKPPFLCPSLPTHATRTARALRPRKR